MLFLVMIVIGYSNYSAIWANIISPIDTYYVTTLSGGGINYSLNILALFNIILFFAVKWDRVIKDGRFFLRYQGKTPHFLLIGLMLVLAYIFVFCFERPSTTGERGTPSALYEYSICFFAVFLYYCNTRTYEIAGTIIVLLFSLQNFIFGGRILGIQFLLVLYLIKYIKSIPKRVLYIGLALMFVMMSLIGTARGAIMQGDLDIVSIMDRIFKSGFALDTSYAAFHTSSSIVAYGDKIPFGTRLSHFFQFIISIFLGGRGVTDYEPAYAMLNYERNDGGTFVSHYFYYYLGIIGTIIGGFLVSAYLNLIRKAALYHNSYIKCVIIYVVSSAFRWYLYTPLGLLRGVLLLSILYYCCLKICTTTRTKTITRKRKGVSAPKKCRN